MLSKKISTRTNSNHSYYNNEPINSITIKSIKQLSFSEYRYILCHALHHPLCLFSALYSHQFGGTYHTPPPSSAPSALFGKSTHHFHQLSDWKEECNNWLCWCVTQSNPHRCRYKCFANSNLFSTRKPLLSSWWYFVFRWATSLNRFGWPYLGTILYQKEPCFGETKKNRTATPSIVVREFSYLSWASDRSADDRVDQNRAAETRCIPQSNMDVVFLGKFPINRNMRWWRVVIVVIGSEGGVS